MVRLGHGRRRITSASRTRIIPSFVGRSCPSLHATLGRLRWGKRCEAVDVWTDIGTWRRLAYPRNRRSLRRDQLALVRNAGVVRRPAAGPPQMPPRGRRCRPAFDCVASAAARSGSPPDPSRTRQSPPRRTAPHREETPCRARFLAPVGKTLWATTGGRRRRPLSVKFRPTPAPTSTGDVP